MVLAKLSTAFSSPSSLSPCFSRGLFPFLWPLSQLPLLHPINISGFTRSFNCKDSAGPHPQPRVALVFHLGRKFTLGSVLGSWDASPSRCALGSSLVGKQGGNRDHEEVITVCSEAWEGEEGQRKSGEVSRTCPVCHPLCPLPSTSHGRSGLLPRLI